MKRKVMDVSEITMKRLRDGKLVKELPELYELKDVIEINTWHDHDPVFNHTLNVMKNLLALEKKLGAKGNALLSRRIGFHTRRELLFLAAMLHDIAKG